MNEPPGGETRLIHLGVLVHQLDAAAPLYRRLGLPETGRHVFDQEHIRIAQVPVDDIRIELMEPLVTTGPLGRFLASRGEGVHHLALEVADIDQALDRARAAGVRLIDESARRGDHGTRVAFIHPSSAHGVLIELVERPVPRSSVYPPA